MLISYLICEESGWSYGKKVHCGFKRSRAISTAIARSADAKGVSLIKTGKHKARTITRANILLMASEGYSDSAIASSLRIHVSTVERTREKFVVGGLEYALEDRSHPPKPRKLDGKQEAFLVATACSNAPEGRTRWTMQLLADQLVNLGIVDSISDETVRQTLKKTK